MRPGRWQRMCAARAVEGPVPRASRAVRFACGLLALAVGSTSLADVEWQTRVGEGRQPLQAFTVVAMPSGGYVLRGDSFALRVSPGGTALTSVDTGSSSYGRRAREFSDRVLLQTAETGCTFRSETLDGRVIFERRAPACPETMETDGGGGLWIALPQLLVRIGVDGDVANVAPLRADQAYVAVDPAPRTERVYALVTTRDGTGVSKLGVEGPDWGWRPAARETQPVRVVARDDDDVWVVLRTGSRLGVARLAARDGLPRFAFAPVIDGDAVRDARVTADGGLLVVSASNAQPDESTLAAFAPDGGLRGMRVLEGMFAGFVDDSDAAEPVVAYLLQAPRPNGGAGPVIAIERARPDASRVDRIATSSDGISSAALLADGAVAFIDGTASPVVRHVALDGSSVAVPDLAPITASAERMRGIGTAPDATFNTLLEDEDGFILRGHTLDGAVRWSTRVERPNVGAGLIEGNALELTHGAGYVCIVPMPVTWATWELGVESGTHPLLSCHVVASGASVLHAATDGDGVVLSGVRLHTGGSWPARGTIDYFMLRTTGDARGRVEQVRVAADGAVTTVDTVVSLPASARTPQGAFGLDGTAYVAWRSPEGLRVARRGAEGTRDESIVGLAGSVIAVTATPDGGLLVELEPETRPRHRELVKLDAAFAMTWTKRITPSNTGAAMPDSTYARASDDAIAVATVVDEGERWRHTLTLVDLTTGRPRWSRTDLRPGRTDAVMRNPTSWHQEAWLAVEVRRERLHVATNGGSQPIVYTHAIDDGRIVGHRRMACENAATCDVAAFDVDVDSLLLSIGANGAPRDFGPGAYASRVIPSVIDQDFPSSSAFRGTWHARNLPGQGFMLDLVRTGSNWQNIGTWFTYSESGDPARAGLRWYTIAGSTHPLRIYRNVQGWFATPPATLAEAVGTFEILRAPGCDRLEVSYAFDADADIPEAGLSGALELDRLVPVNFDCREVPEPGPTYTPIPPANGFERGQFGAWYSPATSGQGFSFDVRPATATDPGLIVGSWYTYDATFFYDIVLPPDDPTAQHWFTLQGDLADARDGRVTVPIYRTIGGALDRKPTIDTHRVGTATIDFDGCAAATVDYRFDDTAVAGPFRRRAGRIDLVRLTPCAT